MDLVQFLQDGQLQAGAAIAAIGPWILVITGFVTIAGFALRRTSR